MSNKSYTSYHQKDEVDMEDLSKVLIKRGDQNSQTLTLEFECDILKSLPFTVKNFAAVVIATFFT